MYLSKVLYVEFINNWVTESGEYLGADEPPIRRIIQIPLTKEQEIMLEPDKVGVSHGKDVYESVRLLSVQVCPVCFGTGCYYCRGESCDAPLPPVL